MIVFTMFHKDRKRFVDFLIKLFKIGPFQSRDIDFLDYTHDPSPPDVPLIPANLIAFLGQGIKMTRNLL